MFAAVPLGRVRRLAEEGQRETEPWVFCEIVGVLLSWGYNPGHHLKQQLDFFLLP